ncbi:hypothetical protein [Streptomyces sp. NPDC051219]|uniref:hypothetical protein n=1 Tax=Streptomyces sp. NPDC051219 TaxID=3155283 RepID=UPI0034148E3E
MTHPFRTRRFLVFAASSAVVAGGVLLPTGAFAAAPTAPYVVAADNDHGNPDDSANLIGKADNPIGVKPDDRANLIGKAENPIVVKPDGKGGQGKGPGKGPGKGGPGKGGRTDGEVVVAPDDPVWVCVAAPCGPS